MSDQAAIEANRGRYELANALEFVKRADESLANASAWLNDVSEFSRAKWVIDDLRKQMVHIVVRLGDGIVDIDARAKAARGTTCPSCGSYHGGNGNPPIDCHQPDRTDIEQ